GCSALEEIDFPETLECIGNWVFRGTSLKKADLSHTSLRNIIWEAFADNASLTEVRLPATCNFVGAKAFAGCDNICVVEVLATEPPTAEAEAFQSPVTEQATLIVPEGSEQAYRNAEVWKEFKNIATPTSLKSAIVDTKDSERIYDLRGVEQNREKGLVIKNGIKIINN
ncbi:MAG: leucine-rich repeat domain-containing protein, partial [Prevotella sp.]|nr:leucine-rich repeat domain-containing protein [Prevotella sp.]